MCPALLLGTADLFCLLTCSPDQATFSNVTAAQTAGDTGRTAVQQARALPPQPCRCACSPHPLPYKAIPHAPHALTRRCAAQVSYFVSAAFGGALFNSCANVVYPPANLPAMKFVGGYVAQAALSADSLSSGPCSNRRLARVPRTAKLT